MFEKHGFLGEMLISKWMMIDREHKLNMKCPTIEICEMQPWGMWCPETKTIKISKKLVENYDFTDTIETLKHEMAHQYVSEILNQEDGHGKLWKYACDLMGAVPRARTSKKEDKENAIINKVEKLFALASSPNINEATLAMEKAQEMMLKYNIDLSKQDNNEYVSHTILASKKSRITDKERKISTILRDFYFVNCIWVSTFDGNDKEVRILEIMGRPENVELADFVYCFLNEKVEQLWNSSKKEIIEKDNEENYYNERGLSRVARNNYIRGVLSGFREKLDTFRQQTTSSDDKGLIHVGDTKLAELLRTRYKRLITVCSHGSSFNSRAFNSGSDAGKNLTIQNVVKHSSNSNLKIGFSG